MTHFISYETITLYWVLYDPTSLVDPRLIAFFEEEDKDFLEGLRVEAQKGSMVLFTWCGSIIIFLDEPISDHLGPFLDSSTTETSFLTVRTRTIASSPFNKMGGKHNEPKRLYLEAARLGTYQCQFTKMFSDKIEKQIDKSLEAEFGFQHRITHLRGYGCLGILVAMIYAIVSLLLNGIATFEVTLICRLLGIIALWVLIGRTRLWRRYRESEQELQRLYPYNVIQLTWSEEPGSGKKRLGGFEDDW
jgi:hypothetical protein